MIAPDSNKLPPVMLPVVTVRLVPVNAPPVMAPVAEIRPAVRILPPCTLPVTDKALKVPTEVILVCAAVNSVPVRLVALTLPAVKLPVALINPPVNMLAPVTLPLELIAPEFNEVNVPTDVILGCAAVVTVPAVVAEVAEPTVKLAAVPVSPVPAPMN